MDSNTARSPNFSENLKNLDKILEHLLSMSGDSSGQIHVDKSEATFERLEAGVAKLQATSPQ